MSAHRESKRADRRSRMRAAGAPDSLAPAQCAAVSASRRTVLKGAAGALLASALPNVPRSASASEPSVTPLRGPFTLVTGAGGNVLVRATGAGQTLVDTGAAEHARPLLEALDSLPGAGRVGTVLNTHWHLDQIGANASLGGRGAAIAAHEKTRLRLTVGYYLPHEDRYREPASPDARPTASFRTHHALQVDGERIELGHLLQAHTDGDIYVRFPGANLVAVGDAVSPLRDPEIDWFGGGWIGGRVDSLARLLELGDDETLYVPSYGPPVGRTDVQAEHDMMLAVFERTTELLRQGYSAADMLEAGVMDELPRRFDDPGKFLYDVHKSLWAHHNTLSHDIV